MYHPSRGGVRGGADQFEWESIKADKHRENYLGHSLMAPVGRWQKNKDLQWFSRDKKAGAQSRSQEKDAVKRMEAEAMSAALGHAGPVKKVQQTLTKQELEEVFKKGQSERDDKDIERVEGMGFGSSRASMMDTMSSNTKETMSAIGSKQDVARPLKQAETTQKNTLKHQRREDKKNKKKKEKRKHKKKKSKESSKRLRRNYSESNSSVDEKSHFEQGQHHNSNSNEKREPKHSTSKRTTTDYKHISRSRNDRDRVSHSIRKRHDSSSDDQSDDMKREKNSRKRHDSSDYDNQNRKRKAVEKPPRGRHDTSSDSDNERKRTRKRHDSSDYE